MRRIIFDLDGVLVNSEPIYRKAWIRAYKEIGINIDGYYHDTKISGNHPMVSTALVLKEFGKKVEKVSQERLNSRKEQISYEIISKNGLEPANDAHKLITELNFKDVPLALASTTTMIVVRKILEVLGIKDLFRIIHTQESVANGKPHPEIYLKIAQILDARPFDCIVFEDSKSGVTAAKAAGMYCIGVLNSHNNTAMLSDTDRIISNFNEISIDEILTPPQPLQVPNF